MDRNSDQHCLSSVDQAIAVLRSDPACSDLVRDAYLGPDVRESAARFRGSAEFAAARRLLGTRLDNASVLEIGAGTGIAAAAMLSSGAASVIALEPDPSEQVGRGAIQRLGPIPGLSVLEGWGERIDVADESIDIVYCRQTLHHAWDLSKMLEECARVLRVGGTFLACREHVVDNVAQLERFRAAHPIHRLAGGENAHPLKAYLVAIAGAGLEVEQVLGPWDSIINAYPAARTEGELTDLPRRMFVGRFGWVAQPIVAAPGGRRLARWWLNRPRPGRLYTFLAIKPFRVPSRLREGRPVT